jgi:threonine/homoserine/homoserine lactone efflux protein
MNLIDASALLTIMVMLAMLPSTSVALVVTRSATLGLAHGAAVSLGIVLGDLIFVLLAIFGLTALSEVMGIFFLVIKYLAGIYLIWFGVTLLTNRVSTNLYAGSRFRRGGLVTSFLAGLFVTLGNLKAIFFYASLFPTFVDLSALSLSDLLVIILVTLITVGGVKFAYAFGAKTLVSLSEGLKLEKEAKLIAGSVMVGTGTYLIVKT